MSNHGPICFADVKAILDELVKNRTRHLKEIHGETFDWSSKQALANAVVEPGGANNYRLIDPELVEQKRGEETNLVVALTKGVGNFSRMPLDGPYASDEQIQTIVNWINVGMPD